MRIFSVVVGTMTLIERFSGWNLSALVVLYYETSGKSRTPVQQDEYHLHDPNKSTEAGRKTGIHAKFRPATARQGDATALRTNSARASDLLREY